MTLKFVQTIFSQDDRGYLKRIIVPELDTIEATESSRYLVLRAYVLIDYILLDVNRIFCQIFFRDVLSF